jgi:hypothetical protein
MFLLVWLCVVQKKIFICRKMDLEKFQEIRIKELQLYKLFPTFDKNLLAEILADNDYDVEQTVNVLADLNSHERSSHSPFLCKEQPNKGDTEANPNLFPIDFLPVDVKLGIFSFLSDKGFNNHSLSKAYINLHLSTDLLACALVNKSWKKLSENTYLWCKQAAAKGLKYNAQTLKSLYASNVSMKRWFYAELRWLKPRTVIHSIHSFLSHSNRENATKFIMLEITSTHFNSMMKS